MTADPEPEPVVCSSHRESTVVDDNTGGIDWAFLADLLEVETGVRRISREQTVCAVGLLLHTLWQSIEARPKRFGALRSHRKPSPVISSVSPASSSAIAAATNFSSSSSERGSAKSAVQRSPDCISSRSYRASSSCSASERCSACSKACFNRSIIRHVAS